MLKNKWKTVLKDEFNKPYMINLLKKLEQEYIKNQVYPPKEQIFNALNYTDYDDTKVLILGQDPYHQQGQAHGFSFSVNKGVKIPPSLKNIYKELQNDLGFNIANNGYLIKWANQGVLLLNSILTVVEGKPNSHKNIGWETFTDAIIQQLNKKETPVVFIFWGNNAKQKQQFVTNKKHLVLTSCHPSPLSATRGDFFGSKPFSKTNDFLIKNKLKPIDWQIENI